METIHKVSSPIPLETPKQIVKFMNQLKEYCLWATQGDFNNGYPNPVAIGSKRLHKPYVDETIPRNEIREFMWVLAFDSKMYPVYIDLLSIGNATKAHVPYHEIYRGTAVYATSCVAVIHNHPSGHTEPSQNDTMFTKKALHFSKFMEIPLIDHIIMGHTEDYYSFLHDGKTGIPYLENLLKQEEKAIEEVSLLKQKIIENNKLLAKQAKKIAQLEKQLKAKK